MEHKETSALALLPFLVFVVVFLGSGVLLGDFYAFPAPVAAVCGVISAFFLPQSNFKAKMGYFMKGCGDENILTMCIIYLLAGAFAVVSKSIGSVDTVINMGVQYLSPQYIPAGVFLISSFLSVSSGTSVGTIVALSPIVFGLAGSMGIDASVVGASLLCGAMFGDNLSFISDTTIAATQSMGCEMKDKFKANAKIAFPAAVFAIFIFVYLGMGVEAQSVVNTPVQEFNFWLIMPYLAVILLSVLGVNVFVVLMLGVVFSGAVGIMNGSLSWLDFSKKIYEGFMGMNDIFLLSLLTGGLAGMVENMGGIRFLLHRVKAFVSSQKSAYLGIGALVSLADIAIANNTIAIVITGKVAEKIKNEYQLSPRLSASVLDIFSCIFQGLIPYGAQVLFLIKLSDNQVDYWEMVQNAWYLHFLLIFVLLAIFFQKKEVKYNA